MRLLILGGTRFLGRHLAQQALAAGHELTLLHRGRSASGIFPEAEHLIADRDREGEFAAALNGFRLLHAPLRRGVLGHGGAG